MKSLMHYSAFAILVGAGMGVAHADVAETKGGVKIKTEDGKFEATIGGRIHYDYSAVSEDNTADAGENGFAMRRTYLSLAGKLYGFKYKLESDIKGSGLEGKDIWIGKDLFGGFVKAGHMQAAYGMEELTSSNDILFVERPFISNNTIFSGREFQDGISYEFNANGFTAMATYYTANPAADKDSSATPNDGKGYAARVTFAPLKENGQTLHLGASYDSVTYRDAGDGASVSAKYVGRYTSGALSQKLLDASAYDSQDTITGELAAAFGPAFLQSEYSKAKFDIDNGDSVDLTSFYVQASFFVTGESKVYKADKGVFGSPKPKNDFGAVELKARYDMVENKDAVAEPKASTISFGANYYVNPNVRFMLDYNLGKFESNATDDDKPEAIVARAQLSF